MRIYAVADIHGAKRRIAAVCANLEKHAPEVLVLAGDVTGLFRSRGVLERFAGLCPAVFWVRGNSDRRRLDRPAAEIAGITSLHLQKIAHKGVFFSGLGGTVPVPFRSRIAFSEKPLFSSLPLQDRHPSVFVAHPPPWKVLDEVLGKFHAGCHRLRDHILQKQPDLMLCGHIHERPGTAVLGKTVVVNCSMGRTGAGAVIELSDAGEANVRFI